MKKRYKIRATCYDKKGRVLSTATNNYNKTHPYQADLAKRVGHPLRVALHAEVLAILRAKSPVHKIKIERHTKDGKPALAMPCPICQLAIKEAGIKFVEYSTGV